MTCSLHSEGQYNHSNIKFIEIFFSFYYFCIIIYVTYIFPLMGCRTSLLVGQAFIGVILGYTGLFWLLFTSFLGGIISKNSNTVIVFYGIQCGCDNFMVWVFMVLVIPNIFFTFLLFLRVFFYIFFTLFWPFSLMTCNCLAACIIYCITLQCIMPVKWQIWRPVLGPWLP